MGFGTDAIMLFGLAQLAAGALLVFGKTRTTGAIVLVATLCVSTVILFMAGKVGFGVFSIVPVVMAGIVIRESTRKSPATDAAGTGEF